jgi:hypothetical protein
LLCHPPKDFGKDHFEVIMSRKVQIILIILAAFAGGAILSAQDELFLGTWELNLAKSSITRGSPPRSETIVNTAEPGGFRSLLAIVNDKSTSVEIQHYNFDGNFHLSEGSDPRELSFKRVDQNTIEQDTQRNGAITVHRHIELSRDGKTMTFTANGTTGGGQKYTNDIRVYEKK